MSFSFLPLDSKNVPTWCTLTSREVWVHIVLSFIRNILSCIVTRQKAGRSWVKTQAGATEYSPPHNAQTGSGGPPSPLFN